MILTKEDSQMVDFVDQNLKCATVDRFNHVGCGFDQVQNPLKDFVFIHQVAGVNCAELVTIEGQSGQ